MRALDLLGKARRLESTIARRFDAATRDAVGAVACEPLEIVHLIVEAVEHEIQPGGRGTRVFPFNRITLSLLASSREERGRFEVVLAGPPSLRDRIVGQLRARSCHVDDLTLEVAFPARASKAWRHPQFNLAFARVARAEQSEARRDPPPARIDVTVVRGTAERKGYSFATPRIDLGRRAEVRDARNRLVRTNHVAFVEGSGAVNQSVSRRHAHIIYEPRSGGFRLRDEGSVHGTSVVRNGRIVTVPPGTLGVRLHTGDEIALGEARLRVRFASDRPAPTPGAVSDDHLQHPLRR
ncbi:MAG: FHA domain-containing protein [Vicinamibacterales bacterium]